MSRIYFFLKKHKKWVFCLGILLFLFSFYLTTKIEVSQNIEIMLPDKGERLTVHYNLLQNSPLTKKIIATISNSDGNLNEAIDNFSENLKNVKNNDTAVFKNITKGPEQNLGLDFLTEGTFLLPNVMAAKDFEYLDSLTKRDFLNSIMSKNISFLSSPAWPGYKRLIENDPLALYGLFFSKLSSTLKFIDITVDDGRFKSNDGKYGLVMADFADSAASFTDLGNASIITKAHNEAAKNNLPANTEIFVISPAEYTLANAKAIINDLRLVIPVSAILLAILFIVFLRTRHAVILFLIPVFSAVLSAAAVATVYGKISGIVLGFSSVLLGITVDYAIHTYLSVKDAVNKNISPYYGLRHLIKPAFFSAVTSITAFSALFVSEIEGIRQFALFGIVGIIVGFTTSIIIIPLIFKEPEKYTQDNYSKTIEPKNKISLKSAVLILSILSASCIFLSRYMDIDANFKNLGYISDEIKDNEANYARIWGKMRDFAIIFASGKTEVEARKSNELASKYLYENFPQANIISISGILPSNETQEKNIAYWNDFWKKNSTTVFRNLEQSASDYGFTGGVFNKFQERIANFTPQPFDLKTLEQKGFSNITDFFTSDGGKIYMTLFYGKAEEEKLYGLEKETDNVTLASFQDFNKELSEIMKEDIVLFCGIALISIIIVLSLVFRNPAKTASALIPVAAGLTGIFIVFAVFGIVMNLFHIVSLPLVIGLGADYGIFMTMNGKNRTTSQGVFLSGMTTIIGFGSLILASHPSLHAIGVTVITGITSSILAALFVVPRVIKK